MTPPPTDEEILLLIARPAQRERGFKLLVNTYGERLYRHIRHMVHTHEDSNDILQNTLVKVHRGIGRFEGKSQLYTWLYRIATNEALTFLERRKRQRRLFIVPTHDDYPPLEGRADTPLDGDHVRARLEEAITRLPPKQKAVFSLRYFEEKNYREMAEVFDTSIGALKASYHHAVKKIEAYLSE